MILSFHPCFVGDVNRLCAGRQPDREDRAAIRDAAAVILPQGCQRSLWQMAREGCANVFPDFNCRFGYSGKTGQARLFLEIGAAHPNTTVVESVSALTERDGKLATPNLPGRFPLVMKYDWGGEGESVFLVPTEDDLGTMLEKARRAETSDRKGIVLQSFIPHHRSLRIVVIGKLFFPYWRTSPDPGTFQASLSGGGTVDRRWRPDLMQAATAAVRRFCRRMRIDLAGFDLLFDLRRARPEPLFLEINHFFGRRGLGGSEAFYKLLVAQIRLWLRERGLAPPAAASNCKANTGNVPWPANDTART